MLFCILLLFAPQQLVKADLSLLVAPQPRIAAESSAVGLRVLIGKKETSAPRLDGRLDDPVWATAPTAADFTQNYPQGGVPATRRTEARVVFVDNAMYVGMRADDSPDSIVAPLMRRDGMLNSDWVARPA